MINDVGKTVKAILYDRIVSPLFGTFLLSWCGWNWRLIILFLTDESTNVEKKFVYVDTVLYPPGWQTISYGLLLPLLTTLFFLYLYPLIARIVYGHWREEQNKLKKLQLEKDGETPLTKEEAQQIREQALRAEFHHQEEREKRETRIRDLEAIVKSLQSQNVLEPAIENIIPGNQEVKPKKITRTYSEDVKNGMLAVMELLEDITPGKHVERDEFMNHVRRNFKLSQLKNSTLLHCIDNLAAAGYISDIGKYLQVLPKGRTALVNNSLDE